MKTGALAPYSIPESETASSRRLIVVAHRLATVVHSDRVLVIRDGKLVGQGRPQELLLQDTLSRKRYEAQSLPGLS